MKWSEGKDSKERRQFGLGRECGEKDSGAQVRVFAEGLRWMSISRRG